MKKKTLIFAALAMVFATAPDCTVKLHAETMQTEEQTEEVPCCRLRLLLRR